MTNHSIILRKLGLTEQDVHDSGKLFSQIPPPPTRGKPYCSKEERLLGYVKLKLRRTKALRVLGASEDDVEIENRKNLASLGVGGRRRSFYVKDKKSCRYRRFVAGHNHLRTRTTRNHLFNKSYKSIIDCGRYRKKSLRRRSTGDILALNLATREVAKMKKYSEDTNAEINRLKHRLQELEAEFESKVT